MILTYNLTNIYTYIFIFNYSFTRFQMHCSKKIRSNWGADNANANGNGERNGRTRIKSGYFQHPFLMAWLLSRLSFTPPVKKGNTIQKKTSEVKCTSNQVNCLS